MKKYYILNTALFWAVFLFTTLFCRAQLGIVDRVFSTNFDDPTVYPFFQVDYRELDDSTIIYSQLSADSFNLVQSKTYYTINKKDLTPRDSSVSWRRDSSINYVFLGGLPNSLISSYIFDQKHGNNRIYFESYLDSSSDLNIKVQRSSNDFQKDTTVLFNLKLLSNQIVSPPFLYDSSLYLFTIYNTRDSAFLYRYDMSGNLLKKKTLTFNFADSTILIFPLAYGPTQVSPLNDSLLVFGNSALEIQFVNRFTLDKVKSIRMDDTQQLNLAVNQGWISMSPNGFIIDSSSITFFGDLHKSVAIGVQGKFQYYRATIDWNGNILDKIHLGNTGINNRPAHYVKRNGNEYFSGSSPWEVNQPFASENRQILLYKLSGLNRDSLFLYGNKNHIATRILVDANEDIFVLSFYSNAWSDNRIYSVITKVPNALLVSVKEYNPKVSSILVYPNPTRDQLRVDGAEAGEFYRVVSITGQLALEGRLSDSKTINVGSLKTGSYFLQLESQQGATYRANVFMKE